MVITRQAQRRKQIVNFPAEYLNPGIIGIAGINQSKDRLSMDSYGAWYIENLEPSNEGWNNRKLGVHKINTSTPATNKVQGIIGYEGYIFYVANGNFYRLELSSGTVTLPSGGAGVFNSSNTVRAVLGRGTNIDKMYLCDGVNTPRVYNPATNTIAPFSFGGSFGVAQTVTNYRNRITWTFVSSGVDKNRILLSAEGDGDDYTGGSGAADSFDVECFPSDGDKIVGLGVIQFAGGDAQQDALVACKSQKSFMAEDIIFDSATGAKTLVFKDNGVDIGAVSADAIIQFANDLWILTETGVKGFLTTLNGSGGVAAFVSSPTSGINPLFKQSATSTAYENCFALNHGFKNKIRYFLPKNQQTSATQNGFAYGEIPNDFCLTYGYDILPKWELNPRGEAFYARGGPGFAFSAGCVHRNTMYLADYFGDVYEFDTENCGDDYIPNSVQTDQVIHSQWETPFMNFGLPFDQFKRILETTFHGRSDGIVSMSFEYIQIHNRPPYEKALPSFTLLSGSDINDVAIYDEGIYDLSIYANEGGLINKFTLTPPGWANAFGLKFSMPSKRIVNAVFESNTTWLYAINGRVELGGLR